MDRSRFVISSTILSFFSPAITLFYGFKSNDRYRLKFSLLLFFAFYGATIHLVMGDDGQQHQEEVYLFYQDMSFAKFWETTILIINLKDSGVGSLDLYKHTLSFLTGSIIGVPRLFFVFVALIYGYFFIEVMFEVFNKPLKRRYLALLSFAFLVLIHKNIEGVNTVRTWTGMWVLMYGLIKYYRTKRYKYLLYVLATPLIHFGYLVMILPILAGLFISRKTNLVFAIFLISLSFNSFRPGGSVLQELEGFDVAQDRYKNYSVEEQIGANEKWQKVQSNQQWKSYKKLQAFGLHKYAFNLLIIITALFYKPKDTEATRFIIAMFGFGVLIHAFSNFTWFVDQISGRSRVLGEVLVFMSTFMILRDSNLYFNRRMYRIGIHLAMILLIPFTVYNLSRWFDHPSVYSFIAPMVVILEPDMNVSLKEVLRVILPI